MGVPGAVAQRWSRLPSTQEDVGSNPTRSHDLNEIIAVTGTGTGIGKTHVACALIGALRDRGVRAVGWKPVESGVTGAEGEDELALRTASGGDIAAPTIRLRAAVAPNVAARAEGIALDA